MIKQIKQFFIRTWERIKSGGRWIKNNIRKVLIGTVVAATISTPIVLDLTKNEVSVGKLQQKYEQATEIKEKYQINGASLKRIVKDDPRDRIEIQVGNKDDVEFSPSLKIARWDDEVNLMIKPKAIEKIATKDKDLKLEGGKIKFETPKIDYHLYELATSTEHPEGAYEFEVILKEKPATNKIEFSLNTKGLDFFYQPELTQKEKDEGANRPENVVGSYAVYCSENKINWKGGKLYRAGKFGHIYYPYLIDANGWKVRAEDFKIELNEQKTEGIIRVIAPQDFLDKAVYPIRHVAGLTFGYEDIGGSVIGTGSDGQLSGSFFTGVSGDATSITVRGYDGETGNDCHKWGIYKKSDGDFLGKTSQNYSNWWPEAWMELSFGTSVPITAVDYWLVAQSDDQIFIRYDTESEKGMMQNGTYDTFPDPLGSYTSRNYKYSIYCTYEAGVGYNKGMAVNLGEGDISGGISGVGGSDGWWDAGWHKRIKLTINNASSTENLTNFPVLVALNSSRVSYADTQDSGQDIRFTDNHGVLLSYEIENWNESGTSTLWVKVPSITAGATNEYVYMYYGNPSASSGQAPSDVWDANFKMVQHMTGASYTDLDDSTSNNNDVTGVTGTPDYNQTAKIGNGVNFTAASVERLDIAHSTTMEPGAGVDFTVEAWAKTSADANGIIATKRLNSGTYPGWLLYVSYSSPNTRPVFSIDVGATAYDAVVTIDAGDNVWHYFVGVREGTDIKIYFDGGVPTTVSASNATLASGATTYVGVSMTGSTNPFDGLIDEIRVSNGIARSAEWIEAQYKTMTDDYITYGSEEKQPKPVAYWRLDEGQGGTIYDDTNNNNDGTVSASSTMGNWTAGKYGNAIDFDGTNDYITASDSTSLSITGDLSVSAWIRPDVVSKEQTIVGKWDETTANDDRSYRLWIDSSNNLNFSVSTDGSAVVSHTDTATTFSAGTWHHIEGVYDNAGTMDLYVNGLLDATQKSSGVPASIDDNISNLYLGGKENTSGNVDALFDGAIDDVRIYNYARSASQVLVDYNGGFAAWLGEN